MIAILLRGIIAAPRRSGAGRRAALRNSMRGRLRSVGLDVFSVGCTPGWSTKPLMLRYLRVWRGGTFAPRSNPGEFPGKEDREMGIITDAVTVLHPAAEEEPGRAAGECL